MYMSMPLSCLTNAVRIIVHHHCATPLISQVFHAICQATATKHCILTEFIKRAHVEYVSTSECPVLIIACSKFSALVWLVYASDRGE